MLRVAFDPAYILLLQHWPASVLLLLLLKLLLLLTLLPIKPPLLKVRGTDIGSLLRSAERLHITVKLALLNLGV